MIVIPQCLCAFVVGWCYYMLAMVMTVYDGVLSMIIQPFVGAIITGLAIVPLLIVGLPLRLVAPINRWWRAHWWLSFVLGTIAFGLMWASWWPAYMVRLPHHEFPEIIVDAPNPNLGLTGWLLTLFAVLHFYPPLDWISRRLRSLGLLSRSRPAPTSWHDLRRR